MNLFKSVNLPKMGIGFKVACTRLTPSLANSCLHFSAYIPRYSGLKQTCINVMLVRNVYVTIPFYPVSCGNRDN